MATGSLRELFGEISLKAGKGLADLQKFNARLDTSEDKLDKAERKTVKLGRSLKKVGGIALGAGKAIAKGMAVGTGLVVAGTVAIFAFTAAWARSADEVGKSAQQLGVSADALQELRFAADLAGASAAGVSKVIRDLSNRSAEAKLTGTGPFADALKEMNIELEAFTDLPVDKQFEFLSDELNKIEDETLRTGLAMRVFGRGAIELGVLIRSGSTGIRAGREELRKYGLVMSPEMLDRAALMVDTLARQNAFFNAMKNIIGAKLAPTVTRYLIKLNKLLVTNKDIIAQRLERVFTTVADAMERGIPVVTDLIVKGGEVIDMVGGIDSAIRAAAEAWVLFKLAALAATGPIGAIAAATGAAFIGLARLERERKEKQRQQDARDARLRDPTDALAGLRERDLTGPAADRLLRAQVKQIEDAQRLRKLRTTAELRQAERFRLGAIRETTQRFGKSGTRAGGTVDPAFVEASKRLAQDRQLVKEAQEAADKSAKAAADARERFDEVLSNKLRVTIDEANAGGGGVTGRPTRDGGAGAPKPKKEERPPTLAEQLAAVVGGKAEDISTVLSAKGVGASINNIDARVFINVGGVNQTFPMPDRANSREVAAVASREAAGILVDTMTAAFDQQRSLLVG